MSGVAARWMLLGEWRAHPGRLIIAALSIAVGVALGFAVHLINASALSEFARAVKTVNGDADLQVHAAGPEGFDEGLYAKLARIEGVEDASPVVEIEASAENGEALTLLGLDVLRAGRVTPSLVGQRIQADEKPVSDASPTAASSAGDPFDANALFLSAHALETTGKKIGEEIELAAAGKLARFSIAGVLPGVAEGQALGVVDIAAAQWRFDMLGRLERIDFKLEGGADENGVREKIAAVLPENAELVSAESEARRTDSLSRAYRVNLDMLALMALLTGGFLVFSAQSLSVTRRYAQFALLRVLGVKRRALTIQVLIEGMIVGAAGSAAGLGLGLVLADASLKFLGGDLGGGYFLGEHPALIFAPYSAFGFFVLGMAAAIAGSLLPARDVARAQPAIALKNIGDSIDPRSTPSARMPAVLVLAGTAAAFAPALGGLPILGYVSIALLLAGGVAAMPLLARLLLAPLQKADLRAVPANLALKRMWGAPSQAAIALCGIVASTSLMIAMAVMVLSFRQSVDEWLLRILPADLYIRVEGEEVGGFDRSLQRDLAATPGVAAMRFRKLTAIRLSPDLPPVTLIAEHIDANNPAASLPLIDASKPVPAGTTAVWVSEPAAGLYGYRAGERIRLPLPSHGDDKATSADKTGASYFVAGIWRDYGRQQGSIAIDDGDYVRLTGDTARNDAWVDLAPGSDAATVVAALRARLPSRLAGRLTIAEAKEIRFRSLEIFDRSFAVTYLLEAIAVLVGLAGVGATFSAQTLAREKEFGMLRHIGVSRRQIIGMLLAEGASLGTVGVVVGIGLGIAISQVLIHVVNPQSFHWTMETRLPFVLFATVTAALIAASAATALLAGRRALAGSAVRAVQEDW
ncbi:MAG TPA: ABC transporter permease [Micropepsaceae bacterium]|nr:ABC transporter permease [Micropepsaceae bacterium]